MERLEIKTAEFEMKPELRCQGMCSGSCSCPTGHCRCNISDSYLDSEENSSSDSYQFAA